MSKIAIIGDTHFSPRTPVSRKDDYPETLLTKLSNLLKYCTDNNIKDCVFLGDLINANQMNMEYFIKLYKSFLAFNGSGIILHSIIGNHDIPHGNPEFLDKSPISLLFDSDLFKRGDFIRDNIYFKLMDYYDLAEQIPKATPNVFNILIGHYFYLSGFGDEQHTLSPALCKDLGYNMYFLGHDHSPYDPLIINGYEVHRPGSFSRATSDTCQVNRDNIKICIFDTDTCKVDYVDLPGVLPSKDIYKEAKLLSKMNEKDVDITLSENIGNLISSLSFDFSSDIYTVLDSMEIEKEIKDKVIEYLNGEGIYR